MALSGLITLRAGGMTREDVLGLILRNYTELGLARLDVYSKKRIIYMFYKEQGEKDLAANGIREHAMLPLDLQA